MSAAWWIAIPAVLVGTPLLAALATRIGTRRAEALVPPAGKFIDVPGARLHYTDEGSGPAIVMVHGLGAQLHNFTYGITGRLKDRYRVICVDRPGAGYSTVTRQPHPGLEGQAAIIADFIAALGLDHPLLVGHSLGGAVSLRLALDHPERIGALALLSPLTQREDDIPKAFKAMVIPSAGMRRYIANTFAVPVGKLGERKTQAAVFAPDPAPDDFNSKGGNALLLRPGSFFAASSEVSGGSGELDDMMARYPSLEVPVAILYARQDKILDPKKHGEAMPKANPRITLDMIDGGHMFPITRSEDAAAWIDGKAQALFSARHEAATIPAL